MKIFSFIISFYLLFLAFQPGMKMLSFSEETETSCCDHKTCEPVREEPAGDNSCGENENCNPFQTCSNLFAFTSEFVRLNLTLSIARAIPDSDTKDPMLQSIAIDFWRPPRIA
jgi:hypothetical protein